MPRGISIAPAWTFILHVVWTQNQPSVPAILRQLWEAARICESPAATSRVPGVSDTLQDPWASAEEGPLRPTNSPYAASVPLPASVRGTNQSRFHDVHYVYLCTVYTQKVLKYTKDPAEKAMLGSAIKAFVVSLSTFIIVVLYVRFDSHYRLSLHTCRNS